MYIINFIGLKKTENDFIGYISEITNPTCSGCMQFSKMGISVFLNRYKQ